MAMFAHFEERKSTDRRRSARRTLKMGAQSDHSSVSERVTIHDLSQTGALLETSNPMLVGAEFHIELPHAGKVEATVEWNSGEFYGCQFMEPLSPAALSAAQLRSLPLTSAPQPSAAIDPIVELRELGAEVERLSAKMDSALRRLTTI